MYRYACAALLTIMASVTATAAEPKWEVVSGKYLTEVRVKDVPKGTAIIWDVYPRDKCQKKIVKSEQSCTVAGEPGEYEVVVKLVFKSGEDFDVEEYSKQITLGGVSPNPQPNPKPDPAPDRKDVQYQIVYVEETSAAVGTRGALFTNKTLDARMQAKGHSWRIVSKDNTAPDVQDEIKKAAGKSYPQMFLNDKAGKLPPIQFDAATKAEDLIKLLEKYGG